MSSLSKFNFNSQELRTSGTPDGPLFCLADVCNILDLGNPSKTSYRVDSDYITTSNIVTSNGTVEMLFVNEAGLYEVIFTSRKPEAKAFKKWVFSEVLPSIRRTGGYQQKELSPLDILKQQVQLMEAQEQRLSQVETSVTRVEKEMGRALSPYNDYYTALAYLNLIDYQDANIEAAKELGRKASRLCRFEGISPCRVSDPRFGAVNSYPIDILDKAFELHSE